ncbi:MAG: hypothetical protein ABJC36_12115 [Gemmatimonadales bacterium]
MLPRLSLTWGKSGLFGFAGPTHVICARGFHGSVVYYPRRPPAPMCALAAQANSKGGPVSDNALANIRASRRAVGRDLKRVDVATAANWEEIKRAVSEEVDNLDEAVQGAQPK